ncbi:MAG: hypothetical protein EA340_07425 [Nitriliruptor sp.]|nr:MAG: hypothetical protein EA340_07425 [Nitriliruptor sp.]
MRCPRCFDDYESGVSRCATCRLDLVPADQLLGRDGRPPVPAPARPDPAALAEQHLGRFHPRMAEAVLALLAGRGIRATVATHDDHTEVAVPGTWRDELRAELVLGWDDLIEALDPDDAPAVLGAGGHAPGWFDAPLGGYIDRDGKLVVDAPPEDDADSRRTLGPAMIAAGAILAVSGWQVVEVPALVIIGVGLVMLGLFLPR